jgi:glutathione S-transferase
MSFVLQGVDLNARVLPVLYGKSYPGPYEEKKTEYLASAPAFLQRFEDFLTADWFAGGTLPTWVDFMMWHNLDVHRLMDLQCLAPYPKLSAFLSRFEALTQIAAFMKSDKFCYWPINNKVKNSVS